jgi:RIO kinase 1
VQGELVLIDVSQAVDLDHPKALDFLREDAAHINAFFRRAGVAVLTNRELFDFAVDASITRDSEEGALAALQARAARWVVCQGSWGFAHIALGSSSSSSSLH